MKQTVKFFSTVFTALYTLLENLLGFIFLALIGIYFVFVFLLSFVGPLVILILLLWEWSFIGERNLLISEQFETEVHKSSINCCVFALRSINRVFYHISFFQLYPDKPIRWLSTLSTTELSKIRYPIISQLLP